MNRQRGFALLIVLWALVMLALLATQLTATARSDLQLAGDIRTAAILEAQADGAVFGAIFGLMSDSPARRGADGRDRAVPVPGGRATTRITSLAGKINPNTASEPLLVALLQAVGMAEKPAQALAAAIADWRTPGQVARPLGAKAAQYSAAGRTYAPPGAAFESVEELGQVLGMTPQVLARLAPHMSVFYPGDPVRAAADPMVAAVLSALGAGDDDTPVEGPAEDGVYALIAVRVERADGAAFSRRAIVWAGHGEQRGRYLVLAWGVGADG